MKKTKRILALLGVITIITGFLSALTACQKNDMVEADPEYLQKVSQYPFWRNTVATSIPEYRTYYHVHDFLDECQIKDGNAVSSNGKIRKVLFIGFDGMRADALPYVLNTANNAKTGVSGIAELQKTGGVYLAYCGGEAGTDTQQTTSTSASWTSHFTGVWGAEHGIKTNDDSKNMQYKTFMLEYAEKGLNTAVAFDWDHYFDVNLKEEVKVVMDNNLPMKICDTDRIKKEKLKDTYAETLELYNFVAPDTPSASAPYDTGMRDYILERMEAGDDIICGIFHNIDTAGHNFGFGASTEYTGAVINCDMYAYSVLQAVKEREQKNNEEWLVVFANDHGGIGKGHGEQSLEERTTWIATNVPFDEKYYSQGYDGFAVK
ncbi:MAG: alkaline phosphatase family protein [Acutalibacteraceae bacterium]